MHMHERDLHTEKSGLFSISVFIISLLSSSLAVFYSIYIFVLAIDVNNIFVF